MRRNSSATTLVFGLCSQLTMVSALVAMTTAGCGSNTPGGMGGNTGGSTGGSGGRAGSGGSPGGGGSGGSAGSQGGSSGGSGGTAGTPDGGGMASGDYFPFKEGNSWSYDVVVAGAPTEKKVHTIVRMEPVGAGPDKDKMVYRVETYRPDGVGDATISWQAREGNKVVRYREKACRAGSVMMTGGVLECTVNEEDLWSPPRVRIDEMPNGMAMAKGVSWDETYTETKITTNFANMPPMTTTTESHTSKWTVVDVGQTVNGYSDCVVLRKTSMQDVPKTYSFCKGVGKVKEEGAGQTEVLTGKTLK